MPKGVRLGGRQKGTPNKVTAKAREAIQLLIDEQAGNLTDWFEEVARTDGKLAAIRCFADLAEFAIPKLARTEVTGKDGGPIVVSTTKTDQKL